jgi:polyphenol oxidase
MTINDLNRRQLCGALAGAALTGIGLRTESAIAQDNPDNCSPIAAGAPVPYKPNPKLPVRIRKSAFELSKTEVDRLKEAYAALRKLAQQRPDDPRGWLRGSYVHCWYCGGGSDDKAGEEIHGSWLFFPWHRAYLHFHERILCRLIRDDTFALPYWDWDSEGRQTFPAVYGDPSDPANPLFDMLRSAKAGAKISNQAVSAKIMNLTMNAPNNNLFMGSQDGDSGAMENAPHGPVHIWTGDTTMQSQSNDMGVLATAAQDPVFFSHHGNIDRLWSVWLGLSPKQHQNFSSSTWKNHRWQFYNEDAVWTQITIADVLDPVKSLRSDYAKPSPKPIWVFKPRLGPANVAALAEKRIATASVVLENAPATAPVALGTTPVTREIALPQEEISSLRELSASSPAQYVLRIRGIQVPKEGQAMFNVFLNLPDATAATSNSSPNFAGTVTVLAKTKDPRAKEPPVTNTAIDVTDVLSQVKGSGRLAVTLVPVAGDGVAPNASQATFRQISLERF